MKFKWIGGNGFKDLDLAIAGIMKPNVQLFYGRVIEVDDSNTGLIERLKVNGNYKVYVEPKKVGRPPKKKEKKRKNKKRGGEIDGCDST